MNIDIGAIRQQFDSLPHKHKLMLGAISAFLVLLMMTPGADSNGMEEATSAPGERVSIAIPEDVTDEQEAESLVVTAEQLQSTRLQQSEFSQEKLAKSASEGTSQTNQILDLADQREISTDESTTVNIVEEIAIANVSDLTTQDGELLAPSELATELLLGQRYALNLDESVFEESQEITFEDDNWQNFVVKRGDNLAKIFSRAGLTAQDLHHVSRAGKDAKKLLKMRPGESIDLLKNPDGSFQQLNYAYSATQTLNIKKSGKKYHTQINQKEVYSRLNYASGAIRSNFWNAGVDAGLSDNQIMSLATIFGWDIDFALDIRSGDSFNVIYEENYIDGEFVGYGDIVAAEFKNQGEEFAAVRYKDGNYYTSEGRSMRKSFLRAPVNFKYISSNFNPRRFHPVTKRWKAHNGIDYAAKIGTPVVAAGDGRVIESSYNRFNGNYVFIQHGDTYVTKYLHFNKRFVKKGEWVKQGQLIGHVGKTGRVTGAHLHYEFLVNGVHKNPRTVKLPKASPIAKKEKAEFLALAKEYKAKLANNRRIMLAMN